MFQVFDIASQGIDNSLGNSKQKFTEFYDYVLGSHIQISLTVVISFGFSSWIINEFEREICKNRRQYFDFFFISTLPTLKG